MRNTRLTEFNTYLIERFRELNLSGTVKKKKEEGKDSFKKGNWKLPLLKILMEATGSDIALVAKIKHSDSNEYQFIVKKEDIYAGDQTIIENLPESNLIPIESKLSEAIRKERVVSSSKGLKIDSIEYSCFLCTSFSYLDSEWFLFVCNNKEFNAELYCREVGESILMVISSYYHGFFDKKWSELKASIKVITDSNSRKEIEKVTDEKIDFLVEIGEDNIHREEKDLLFWANLNAKLGMTVSPSLSNVPLHYKENHDDRKRDKEVRVDEKNHILEKLFDRLLFLGVEGIEKKETLTLSAMASAYSYIKFYLTTIDDNLFYSHSIYKNLKETVPTKSSQKARDVVDKQLQNIMEVLDKRLEIDIDDIAVLQEESDELTDLYNRRFDFWMENKELIEIIRSKLFSIKNECLAKEGIIQGEEIDNCHKELSKIIYPLEKVLTGFIKASENSGNMFMTTDFLFIWFGLKLLGSDCLGYYQESKSAPEVRRMFTLHFVIYFLYILHIIRNYGIPSRTLFWESDYPHVTSSQLYLVSEFAFIDLELNRSIPLLKSLNRMWTAEAVLYTVKDTYREHLHHTVNTCLLGYLLIDSKFDGTPLVEKIGKRGRYDWKDEKVKIKFLRNWFFGTLLHDIGYIIDLPAQSLSHIDFFHSDEIKNYYEKIAVNLHQSKKDLVDAINSKAEMTNNIKELDHGVVSAFHLHHMLETISKKNGTPDLLDDLTESLYAIIKHSHEGEVVDAGTSPLSFLLLLCDHLQEWNRPRVDSGMLRQEIVTHLLRPGPRVFESNTILSYLKLNAKFEGGHYKFEKEIDFELVYKDAEEEMFEPALIWICVCEDLKKIKKGSMSDLKVKIKMTHPIPQKLAKPHRFTEKGLFNIFAMQDNGVEAIRPWLDCLSPCGSISYSTDGNIPPQYEYFEIKLEEYSNDHPGFTLPINLYGKFCKWKENFLRETRLKGLR